MMFYFAFGLFVVGVIVSYYNAWLRSRFQGMIDWLREQHLIIEMHDEYREEACDLWNDHIPLAKQWLQDCEGFRMPIIVIQSLNTVFMFLAMIGATGPILNTGAALANAALIVGFLELRKRRFTMEGICQGTLVLVDAIKIQEKEEEKVLETKETV